MMGSVDFDGEFRSGQRKSTSKPSKSVLTIGSGKSSARNASSAPLLVPALPLL